jgi:hypothetical protein
VKYNREALIEACDRALERDANSWLDRRAKNLQEHASQVANWNHRYAAQWAEVGLAVRRAVREGRPITRDMLPYDQRRHDSVAVFYPTFDFSKGYEEPRELAFLRRVLDVVTDEFVTTTGLAQLGVSTRTMRDAAWQMAPGSAKE